MAIAVELVFNGATLEQYDQACSKMGFQPCGTGEPGGLFHWVTKTPNGFRIVDVWESKEIFERFAQEKIGPITGSVGMTEPPEITYFEVYNYLTAP